jgi:regulatory protein YycI of two-component signal transduction system YycFG
MELHSLDNFPTPKADWSMGQKVFVITLTLGLGFLIWRYVMKKNQQAQVKIAESAKQAERAMLEKSVTEQAVEQTVGQGILAHVQNIVNAKLPKDENPSDTEPKA